jgi:hypothetical protein
MEFSISRRKGACRWREIWLSKIDSNWSKHCCFCWFVQKWPSNRIKNDSIIFEIIQDCSSSHSERELGKEKIVCTFCFTILDTWAKGRSSHNLPRNYRVGRRRQINKNTIGGKKPGVLPLTWNKATECSEWVGKTFPRTKKFQRSHIKNSFINFFDSEGMVQKEFIP